MFNTLKALFIFLCLTSFTQLKSQGISFSYLFPTNGYLSAPVSPFSVRGVGVDFGLVGLETGFTLYNIPGLSIIDLPFKSNEPLIGPGFATLVPAEISFGIDTKSFSFKVLGGGFGVWNIRPRLNYGNLDRAIRTYEGWDVANADFKLENKLGIGWMAGVSLAIHINNKYSLTTEVHYLSGGISTPLTGEYIGGASGGNISTKQAAYPNAKTLLQGFEISVGVSMN